MAHEGKSARSILRPKPAGGIKLREAKDKILLTRPMKANCREQIAISRWMALRPALMTEPSAKLEVVALS